MDYLQRLQRSFRQYLFALITIENFVAIGADWWLTTHTELNHLVAAILSLVLGLSLALGMVWLFSHFILQPVRALWQAILHLSPTDQGVAAPELGKITFGQELVASLVGQLHQLTHVAQETITASQLANSSLSHNFVAQNLPLPFFALDPTETIKYANNAAAAYVGIPVADLIGKNIYMVLDMSFPSEETFDVWLKDAKTKSATSTHSWERVRLNVRDSHPTRLFDLAAYFNRDNPGHTETMLVLFDHTKQYSQDDQAVSFIALTVHELRTPLTLLRGYIEVFEEEFDSAQASPELHDFMQKMRASAEQLTAFVNNILNVARVDNDQLLLELQSEDWATVLKNAIEDVSLRAKVRGITLECHIDANLPPVGIDRLSIREVVNNLIDNAIKYSGTSKVIRINAHLNDDGQIETTVQDFGLGISSSIMPNLFTKFYRDHRNRAQIGGTGLGLYLSKAIITAHGGNLWVRSKAGEGSTFGFSVLPYSALTEELKRSGNQEITRGARGWIKNHSLYRR